MLLRMISFWVRCSHCATVANAACFAASNDFVANQVSLPSLADCSALPTASTDLPTIEAAIRVRPFRNDYRLGFASSIVIANILIVRIWGGCRGKAHQHCDQGCLHGSQHDTGLSGECPSKAFKEKADPVFEATESPPFDQPWAGFFVSHGRRATAPGKGIPCIELVGLSKQTGLWQREEGRKEIWSLK